MTDLRRPLRWIRYLPERLAHGRRRARAMAELRGALPAPRMVFVCLGNVCRSPYAEGRARAQGLAPTIVSRGFIGPGRTPPDAALRVAQERGLDLGAHRSQLLDGAELADGDVVFVMNPEQRAKARAAAAGRRVTVLILGDLDPEPIERREIPDPWGRPDTQFHASYARIDRILHTIARIGRP